MWLHCKKKNKVASFFKAVLFLKIHTWRRESAVVVFLMVPSMGIYQWFWLYCVFIQKWKNVSLVHRNLVLHTTWNQPLQTSYLMILTGKQHHYSTSHNKCWLACVLPYALKQQNNPNLATITVIYCRKVSWQFSCFLLISYICTQYNAHRP